MLTIKFIEYRYFVELCQKSSNFDELFEEVRKVVYPFELCRGNFCYEDVSLVTSYEGEIGSDGWMSCELYFMSGDEVSRGKFYLTNK